jgi:DNA-binding NarL/FixJ family response regulator
MAEPVPVWVDHRDAVVRRGVAATLTRAAFRIAGESAGLEPLPDVTRIAALVLEVDDGTVARAAALTRRARVPLVGIAGGGRTPSLPELERAGLAAVLGLRSLTPTLLLRTVQAVTERRPPPSRAARAPARPGHALTDRELDVLRLLADGATTRDIACRLNYSERTIKAIVRELMDKLRGRTRAHAVANAARIGML